MPTRRFKMLDAILFVILLLIGYGCSVKNKFSIINFAHLYNHAEKPLITGLKIFHESDSNSRVYVRYKPSSLHYVLKMGRSYYRADYSISYRLFSSYESAAIVDSSTFKMFDSLYFQNDLSLVYNFPIKTLPGNNYVVEIKFSDSNRGIDSYYSQEINRKDANNSQHFLLVDQQDEVIFEEWVSWKTKFRIITPKTNLTKLFVDYYDDVFPAARTPFSLSHSPVYQLKPKEKCILEINDGITDYLQYGREGFFHFRSDSMTKDGFTIFRFHDDYPEIKESELMPGPMRYITTDPEYAMLAASKEPQTIVEKFWIEVAGNERRGFQLLENYYDLVKDANLFFTSYKEGWKTDRGMIYMIFGAPTEVFKKSEIETWIYGDPQKRTRLHFDFIQNKNPFTTNDFELVRQPDYKNPYFVAVDYLRR